MKTTFSYVASVLALSAAIAGCGAARSGKHGPGTYVGGGANAARISVTTRPIKYAPSGLKTLVRQRIPGGYFSIVAERYEYLGHTYSVLNDHEEKSKERGGSAGGGPDIERGQDISLEMGVSRGCLGPHAYALAYGMLRDPKDLVTAQADGTMIRFKRVVIPANFHPDGVLVYAALGQGQNNVVERTPNGEVAYHEHWTGVEASACHGR